MSVTQNLIKVGDAVLTPEAISFLELMQDENNSSLKEFRQLLLEMLNSSQLLLNNPEAFPKSQIEHARKNLTELSMFYYDLLHLYKP